ncbi:hygromycin-B 7''-O-kinase [Saccharothrix tamanrassetensis]|uniref:Hygromycin-B 7''-O-kinase n=1 Tax=Saccharothrix tamanrassetensis TaxID=1051531 RepID=A0A841CIL3_9PSEU|nr:aminoglycoside 3'-phosphotransferase/choline kinase family protein [Saccharothrix tamanrassetensis]MBB5958342.1 hygromycin-B 7''-O-kinase [Saccharothrix tamanrassetensis]
MTFPIAQTEEQFDAVAEDEQALRPAVDALCRHLGIDGDVGRFAEGSLPVYAVGERHVLKLFPAVHLDEVPVERDVLAAVQGRLPVPTPEVFGAGEFGGWGYVHMERLHGASLRDVWPNLGDEERQGVARQAGEALAALHAITPPVAEPADWGGFVAAQKRNCVARQESRQLDPFWLEQVPGFLDSVDLGDPELVLAHTEVMSAHLLVRDGRLSGLFDFEPAMRAAREYEFVATGVFLTRGDAAANAALYDGYGQTVDPRKVMAYALLHVYSDVAWYLREVPTAATSLDGLAEHWFGPTG